MLEDIKNDARVYLIIRSYGEHDYYKRHSTLRKFFLLTFLSRESFDRFAKITFGVNNRLYGICYGPI